jgi:XTP/dITP diphosphohydrolase
MIPRRLVLATANPGKTTELAELLREWGTIDVLDLACFPGLSCPEERGTTYAQNAVAKASAVAAATGLPALADDSGLEVDALDGAPGVYSARYAGPGERVAKLLAEVAHVPAHRRSARFRCVVAIAWPGAGVETAEGECRGRLAIAPSGSGGFGYDPVFVSDDLGKTFGDATAAEKQRVSHRARAVRALGERLRRP